MKLIQHLRNEAHRFSLAHHRNKRSKASLHSQLDDIPGIGPKTKTDLLKKFKSLKRIKEAPLEALTVVIGLARAKKIMQYFEGGESKN